MIDAGPAMAVSRLRTSLARTDETRTDGQLLAAFTRDRDADAFATLVYRHGPTVLGVCRRVCRHDHDADDAFQAVFLVLARRAVDVNPPDAVGAWLYGVAFRTAQDARVMAAQRRARFTPTATVPDLAGKEMLDAGLAEILDAEIARLPEHYRAAVVLCELNGVSRSDAAKRLGIAEGTLSSRLAEARKRLAAGLKRKGFALPAVLAAALASNVSGSDPVFSAAFRWGQLTAAGEPIPTGVLLTLADRTTRIMYLKKLTTLSVLTALGVLFLSAGWMTFHRALADDKPMKADGVKPAAAKAGPGRLLVWTHGNLKLFDPDGKNEAVFLDRDKKSTDQAVLSPDGKTVAFLMHIPAPPGTPIPVPLPKNTVHVRKLDEKEPTDLKLMGQMIAWSPDGKELMVTDFVDGPIGADDGPPKTTTTVIDVASKKEATTGVPNDHFAFGFTPDGKGFVTMHYEKKGDVPVVSACIVSRDGKEVKVISDPKMMAYLARLSPDGKTLLYRGHPAPDKVPEKPLGEMRLYVQPVGGKAVEVADVPQNAHILGYCWSPDGKKIAYTWRQVHTEKAEEGKADERETESHLVVCDTDGKNAKTILTEKGVAQYHVTLSHVDWR